MKGKTYPRWLLSNKLRAAVIDIDSDEEVRYMLRENLSDPAKNKRLLDSIREVLLERETSFLQKNRKFGTGYAKTEEEAIREFRWLWSIIALNGEVFPLDEKGSK